MPPLRAVRHHLRLSLYALYALVALAAVVPARAVSAHGDNSSFLWVQFDPGIWLAVILAGAAYIYATGVIEQRDPTAVTTRQTWYFLGGLAILFFALQGPLDAFSDDAFWVHMIQHIVIVSIVPPLLLIGTPTALVEPLLRLPGVLPVMRLLTNAGVAWLLSTAVFFGWHIPALYNAAVLNDGLHSLEHVGFLFTAILFWWPVFGPAPDDLPRLTRANQVLYLAVSCQPNVVLGAVLVFGPQAYYAVYGGANRLMPNLSPLVDQQIGGSIMWVPGNLLYLGIISKLFFDWFTERDRADKIESADSWREVQEAQTRRDATTTASRNAETDADAEVAAPAIAPTRAMR